MGKMSVRQLLAALASVLALSGASPSWADVAKFEQSMREANRKFSGQVKVNEGAVDGYVLITTPQFDKPFAFRDDALLSGNFNFWNRIEGGQSVKLNADEVRALKKELLAAARTDSLVGPVGNGKNRLIVLSAPDCPACRSMEADLKKFAAALDLSVYYLPELLQDPQGHFMREVTCSADPVKAWQQSWIVRPQPKFTPACLKSAQNTFLAELMMIERNGQFSKSTPAIVKADGSTVSGWPRNATLASVKQFLGL